MTSHKRAYVDIVPEQDRFRVVVVMATGEHHNASLFETIQDAFEDAQAVAADRGFELGSTPREDTARGFVVRVLESVDDSLAPGLMWAPDMQHAESLVSQSLTGTAYTRALLIPVDSGGGLQITVGRGGGTTWILPCAELKQALEGGRLTQALRDVLAKRAREKWGGGELFELLRYGLGLDHGDASLVLYWETDASKAPDFISDAELDGRLEEKVRAALARPGALR